MTTVVVTGANRGLGLALVQQYTAAGADVIAGCRHPDTAGALKETKAEVHPLDMSSEASIAAFAAAVGDRPVNLLINNAGIDAK
ncbi:MAG TPA: SDR family NAD(P)-dependent oxidoreductase, partial [Ilumatobacteraceae bacterium]|nr:SDR family NAD(P)-dependent oxidoreductase [Ilumatobacteraceae bacterium]